MFRTVTGAARAAAVAALASIPVLAQAPPVYHAEYLGNAKHVAAMNESGLVVGTGAISFYPRAWVAGPGQPLAYLPLPFGFLSSGARDVNEDGVIVGVMSPYTTTAFYPQPVRWDPDGAGGHVPTLLATLPGHNRGTADAINDLGDIVGTSSYQSDIHTVLFAKDGTLDLPGLGAYPAQSLNNQRTWVGSGAWRADLDTLLVEDLGVPAGFTAAHGWIVNDLGQVAGDATGGDGCAQQVALFTDGLGWQQVGPCGFANVACDLNDLGDVLMTWDGVPWVAFAGGGTHRVEDLIATSAGPWTVDAPSSMALNGARQMAVHATNGGLSGILLLTPEGQTCQADLGFGGPGALELSFCGGDLSSGTTADVHLSGAQPGGVALLLAGAVQQPTPFKGGTLVPVPLGLVMALATDGAGHATLLDVPGGGGPFSVVLQAVQHDAAQPKGWALSNALKADFLP